MMWMGMARTITVTDITSVKPDASLSEEREVNA
jgi:hypothetical protein